MQGAIHSTMVRAEEDASAWDAALGAASHDVYHLAGYHRFAGSCGEGDGWLAVVRDGDAMLAWPYLLRPASADADAPSGLTDVTSVYGYPGPVASGCQPGDEFLARAWQEIVRLWREQGAISAFTRFHPLLGNASLAEDFTEAGTTGSQPPATGVVNRGTTVSVDCTLADEDVLAAYARPLRQHLAAARRAGGETVHDQTWQDLAVFVDLYLRTMARNRSAGQYWWRLDDFGRLREALGGRLHLLITRIDGVPAAAGVFTELDGIVQAHLVGSDDAFRSLSPTKLLLDDARRWARDRGDRTLHLGGGRGGREDSLFRFKREFSSQTHPFHTGRWVLDGAAYEELTALHRSAVPADSVLDDGFFPAYRAPLVEPSEAFGAVEASRPQGTVAPSSVPGTSADS